MVQESGNTHDISSLTSCFRYIIDSQSQDGTSDVREILKILYKWAFKILKSGKTGSAWTRVELVDEIGQDCFGYCQQKGFLVNTKFHVDGDDSNPMLDGYKMVAEIFYEWFVAHYVTHIVEDRPGILDQTLQAIDPASHQHVYRFACGLSNICSEKILKYLEKNETWKDLALLCMVEQSELAENFEKSIRRLCSTINEIKDEDSALMERSKLQLIKIASWKKIPIKEILLMGCFSSLDLQLETIVLKSGQELPRGLLVTELRIQLEENLTTKHVEDILQFATKCEEMEKLGFDDCNDEIPINKIDTELLDSIRSKGLQIEWFSRNGGGYQLNLQSGIFELQQEE
ncbi:hypothetical protein HOLleu_40804 [Holothuria leucospilota]|uniref:Uncharacterized protein n=1 Tax=Holothuria leucospilota TaxID=206669 RepID=A0A9Q1BDV8_HOLLE|nr:hypothetical protein HOLleu_40804 [Holothuria leucospilota]